MTDENGFTLIELLVVIAIMGCLMLAAPILSSSLGDRVRLGFALRNDVAMVHAAESEASSGGQPVSLTADQLRRNSAVSISLLDSITGEAISQIWFYPDQSASAAHVLIRRGAREEGITIDAMLGRVDQDR